MSRRSSSSNKGPKTAPPTPDVYVGLLFVSLAALSTAIIFLVLELNRYEWAIGS